MKRNYLLILIHVAIVSLLLYSCRTSSNSIGSVTRAANTEDRNARKLLLRDEGLSKLSYIDLGNPNSNWYVDIPNGRDMQLTGNGLVMIGTGTGYEEREIATGNKVNELTSFNGTIAARRLRNGNTLLTGLNWQGKQGIVLLELDRSGRIHRLINYPQFNYVRLVRETVSGTFLITSDDTVFEGNASGDIVWQARLTGRDKPHAWQALRLANGQTIVSGGYTANLQVFGQDGKIVSTITGPLSVKPNFFAGLQILYNGNYMVTNWQGHGPNFGAVGTQLLEYNSAGELVWYWKQDAAKFSSLQGVIVIDSLDVNKLYVEDEKGVLVATN